ncbi:MAG: formyl transferase [Flavobacteriaceae bacterium]|nr:formyl transferase [Flavobacteriaceae bacterium]
MKIVLFCGKGESNDIVYSFLKSKYDLVGVIMDGPSDKKKFIKRRIKKLGWFKVISQLLFMKGIIPLLKFESRKRTEELSKRYDFEVEPVVDSNNIFISTTINDPKVIDHVKKINPDLIIVNGTRIIKKTIIDGVGVPMINMHVGVTPKYRGVHGGYWALANNDAENCGVTAHLIDPGIDTGGVISQRTIEITKKDNYCTYPLLQVIEGLKCYEDAIEQVNNNNIKIVKNNLESKLYYHPTIFDYFYYRLFKGVK